MQTDEERLQAAKAFVSDVVRDIFKQEISDEEVCRVAKKIVKTLPKVRGKKEKSHANL